MVESLCGPQYTFYKGDVIVFFNHSAIQRIKYFYFSVKGLINITHIIHNYFQPIVCVLSQWVV